MRVFSHGARQRDVERGTVAGCSAGANGAAMRLDVGATDRQTEPGAPGIARAGSVGTGEAVEEVREQLGWHAIAIVDHRDMHGVQRSTHLDVNPAAIPRVTDSVGQEVHEHVDERVVVAVHHGGDCRLINAPRTHGISAHALDRLGSEVTHVDRSHPLDRDLPRAGQQ